MLIIALSITIIIITLIIIIILIIIMIITLIPYNSERRIFHEAFIVEFWVIYL